jgi:DNA-directed RNA polymerase specialized sigma24 family protein
MPVSSEEIVEYLPRILAIAKRLRGRFGSEVDDLVQEGMIAVWLALDHNLPVTDARIVARMRAWNRYARSAGPIERLWQDVH